MTRPGLPLFLASVVITLGAITTGVMYYLGARADCHRSVEIREDQRAIWLEAFDLFPDSLEAESLHRTLDERLPCQRCDGTNLIPIPLEEP